MIPNPAALPNPERRALGPIPPALLAPARASQLPLMVEARGPGSKEALSALLGALLDPDVVIRGVLWTRVPPDTRVALLEGLLSPSDPTGIRVRVAEFEGRTLYAASWTDERERTISCVAEGSRLLGSDA